MTQMTRIFCLCLTAVCLLLGITACMADEEYTTAMDARLTFSKDTISFDTIFSGQPTGTYTFMVYNPSKKAIRIPEVRLAGGTNSPYRVNIDGMAMAGGSARDFEIAARDSMRVFLFVNPPEKDQDALEDCSDELIFTTEGGAVCSVILQAKAQDVYRKKGWVVTRDTILQSNRPYQILDSLVVAPGVTLTLAPGTQLFFHADAGLRVEGTLMAVGTLEQPVLMRGDRLGNMFTNQSYDAIPGQWQGVTFTETSYDNYLSYCDIHSGTYGLRLDSCDRSRMTLSVENSVIHNFSGHAIEARSARMYMGNSQVTNAGGDCLHLRGGHYLFLHCTIGNFYPFAGGRGVALDFANYEGESRLPLEQLAFVNSIVTGYSKDEIMGSQSERYTDDAFSYVFQNCLLNTPEDEEMNAVNVAWDVDEETAREQNFYPAFDLDRLIFTFGLHPKSKAVGIADLEFTQLNYPKDRLGRDRMADGTADAGCYEAQPLPEAEKP